MHILVIEDDQTLNLNITTALQASGFSVTNIFEGLLAERILKKEAFDGIVLDVNLPGKNGFDICKNFRTYNTITPVILLTAFSQIDDKIYGFNCGADDYLTKPFFMQELIIRIQALLKRKENNTVTNNITFDDIIIDIKHKVVIRNGENINLTPREFQIILKLCEANGSIVSKQELVNEIWGKSFDANTNTIEVYINFLRNKLDKPFEKNTIKTKIGFGYYLEA